MILLRHGQSEFNLHFAATRKDPGIIDPRLTELGHAQAVAAAEAIRPEGIRRIITSPYSRALQTAAVAARILEVPVLINPIVRERYAFACDVGSPVSTLRHAWPDYDFSGLEDVWWPAIEEPAESVVNRAALFRAEIAELPTWSDTLVVSHWGFILCMTGRSAVNCEWMRCDPTEPAPGTIAWRA